MMRILFFFLFQVYIILFRLFTGYYLYIVPSMLTQIEKHREVLYCTVQYSTVYSTVQYSTITPEIDPNVYRKYANENILSSDC